MTSYSALSAVSVGVYTALNVAALLAVAPGGVGDDIAQGTGYPFVLYEVNDDGPQGGFGTTTPGSLGAMPKIALRVFVFSTFQGFSEAQGVMAIVTQLLVTPPTITGYACWAIWKHETISIADSEIAGVKVKELTANWTLDIEATA